MHESIAYPPTYTNYLMLPRLEFQALNFLVIFRYNNTRPIISIKIYDMGILTSRILEYIYGLSSVT